MSIIFPPTYLFLFVSEILRLNYRSNVKEGLLLRGSKCGLLWFLPQFKMYMKIISYYKKIIHQNASNSAAFKIP